MGHEKSAVGASEFRPDGAEIGWPPSRPEPFRVEVQTGRDRTAVAPVGELDLATAGPLQDALNELEAAGSERLVLDLRRVSFMDWWGLRTVLSADLRARQTGRRLEVLCGPGYVTRLLALTGTYQRLDIVEQPRTSI